VLDQAHANEQFKKKSSAIEYIFEELLVLAKKQWNCNQGMRNVQRNDVGAVGEQRGTTQAWSGAGAC
jgi:hypothetical protein